MQFLGRGDGSHNRQESKQGLMSPDRVRTPGRAKTPGRGGDSSVMAVFEALQPGLANMMKKKKITTRNGGKEENYVIAKDKMEQLQVHAGLSVEDKMFLKENQLRYEIIRYIPHELSDEQSGAESADSIEQDDDPMTARPDPKALKVAPLIPPGGEKTHLLEIMKKMAKQGGVGEVSETGSKRFAIKKQITVKEMMDGLHAKQWVFMKHLLAFLKHKSPLTYNQFPGFYDQLSTAIIKMNQESVEGLVDIYNYCTIWLHKDYPGQYAVYSKFRTDTDQHIFQHGVGEPLRERYNPEKRDIMRWMRSEPSGEYTNEAHLASLQIPLNISYGSEDSLRFLKSLEKCKNNQVFKIPVVQGYLNYKWDQSKQFLLAEAILHILFLISFNVFANERSARDHWAAKGFVLFFCLVFALRESFQIFGRKLSYFTDPFNYPDLGMIICCLIAIFVSGSSAEDDIALQWPVVIGLLLLYTRLLSYFRLWGRTRHLIRSITETFHDMIPFVLIMVVLLFAFASAYIACFEPAQFKQYDYAGRLFKGFELLLGAYEDPENGPHYLMFVVLSIVALVVLLNMLIAIMGDTFGRVQSNTIVYDYRERLSVNIDLESLIYVCARKKKKLFHIGIARRPSGFDMEEDSFSEQNKLLRRLIKDNMKSIQEAKASIDELKTGLKR